MRFTGKRKTTQTPHAQRGQHKRRKTVSESIPNVRYTPRELEFVRRTIHEESGSRYPDRATKNRIISKIHRRLPNRTEGGIRALVNRVLDEAWATPRDVSTLSALLGDMRI